VLCIRGLEPGQAVSLDNVKASKDAGGQSDEYQLSLCH